MFVFKKALCVNYTLLSSESWTSLPVLCCIVYSYSSVANACGKSVKTSTKAFCANVTIYKLAAQVCP